MAAKPLLVLPNLMRTETTTQPKAILQKDSCSTPRELNVLRLGDLESFRFHLTQRVMIAIELITGNSHLLIRFDGF
jgi:hypothetical protein